MKRNIDLRRIQIFNINLFFVIIVTMLANLINCSDSSDVKISVPEIICKSETFISDDYIFDNEGLYKPIMIRDVPDTKELIVLDKGNTCFYVFSPEGKYIRKIGRLGQGPGDMLRPLYFNVDKYGDIYVYEFGNRRLSIFNKEGIFINSFRIQYRVSPIGKNFSNLFVNTEREILINLPETGYYITVFNRKGDIIRNIGKIPDYIMEYIKLTDIFSLCYPFVTNDGKYYIFLQSFLAVYIYDKNGKKIDEKNLGKILNREDYIKEFISPEERIRTGKIGAKIFIQDMTFKNDKFYLLSTVNESPITEKSKRYVYVLDKELQLINIYLLPSILGETIPRDLHKFEVMNEGNAFLMPIEFNSKIFIYKPI